MFVGEIRVPRREYLYEYRFIDMLLISRGYVRRYHPGWEQARLIAYHVRYCMGLSNGETAKPLDEWLTFPWEKIGDTVSPADLPTEREIEELRQLMIAENAEREKAKAQT